MPTQNRFWTRGGGGGLTKLANLEEQKKSRANHRPGEYDKCEEDAASEGAFPPCSHCIQENVMRMVLQRKDYAFLTVSRQAKLNSMSYLWSEDGRVVRPVLFERNAVLRSLEIALNHAAQ